MARGVVGSAERAASALEHKRAKRAKELSDKNRAISNVLHNYKREHKKTNVEIAKEAGIGRDRFSKGIWSPEKFTIEELRTIQEVLGIPNAELAPFLL